jgi:hypothetical protein
MQVSRGVSGGSYDTWIVVTEKKTNQGHEKLAVRHLRNGPVQVARLVNGHIVRQTEFKSGRQHDAVLNILRSHGVKV